MRPRAAARQRQEPGSQDLLRRLSVELCRSLTNPEQKCRIRLKQVENEVFYPILIIYHTPASGESQPKTSHWKPPRRQALPLTALTPRPSLRKGIPSIRHKNTRRRELSRRRVSQHCQKAAPCRRAAPPGPKPRPGSPTSAPLPPPAFRRAAGPSHGGQDRPPPRRDPNAPETPWR